MAKQLGNFVQDLRLPRGFHRELRFSRMLRKHGAEGVYAVLVLWDWVAENYPTTGVLIRMTEEDILFACSVDPKNMTFIADLIEEGFLGKDENGVFCIPNWREEQPYVAQAEERSRAAQLKAEKRWGPVRAEKAKREGCFGNAAALPKQCSNTNSNAFKSPPTPPKGREGEIPVNEIMQIYAEVLPELPQPEALTEKMRRDIEARWKTAPERRSLKWWRDYFGRVRERPFLMGEGGTWRASLGWLVNGGCMDKVLGGEYPTRSELSGPQSATESYTLEEFERMQVGAVP